MAQTTGDRFEFNPGNGVLELVHLKDSTFERLVLSPSLLLADFERLGAVELELVPVVVGLRCRSATSFQIDRTDSRPSSGHTLKLTLPNTTANLQIRQPNQRRS